MPVEIKELLIKTFFGIDISKGKHGDTSGKDDTKKPAVNHSDNSQDMITAIKKMIDQNQER
jgi:hypothetical protein